MSGMPDIFFRGVRRFLPEKRDPESRGSTGRCRSYDFSLETSEERPDHAVEAAQSGSSL
jgi:hypothetical protein